MSVSDEAAIQKLSVVRVLLTRIQHVLESIRHLEDWQRKLDGKRDDERTKVLTRLRESINTLVVGNTGKKKKERASAVRVQESQELLKLVRSYVSKKTREDGALKPVDYHIDHIRGHLEELVGVLTKDDHELLQPQRGMGYLKNAVSHFLEDFDTMQQERLGLFIKEMNNEGVRFSQTLDDSENANALVSVRILDVAVGVAGTSSVRPALDHFKQVITMLEGRVNDALNFAKELRKKSSSTTATSAGKDGVMCKDPKALKEQIEIMSDILESCSKARGIHTEFCKNFAGEEEEIFARAQRSNPDFKSLLDEKKFKSEKFLEGIRNCVRELELTGIAFLSPMYYRTHQLTYATPMQIRVAIRFYSPETRTFTDFTTLCPTTESANGQLIPQELHPSSDQIWLPFDQFPELVKGRNCVLRDMSVEDHQRNLEESREVGGYYICRGSEKIVRSIILQRSNVPVNVERSSFTTKGFNFSPRGIIMRCKRASSLACMNFFYYQTTGDVVFSFARRMVWHVPVVLLMLAMKPVSIVGLMNHLTSGVENQITRSRVEALLQHHRNRPYANLSTQMQFLSVLGRRYRQYQQESNIVQFIPELGKQCVAHTDAWYGLFMLRRHVLPHLNVNTVTPDETPGDNSDWLTEELQQELEAKYHAMVQIVKQLHSFVSGDSQHMGVDSPAFQEIFTPSQLALACFETCVMKYMKPLAWRLAKALKADVFKQIIANRNSPDVMKKLKGFIEYAKPSSNEALLTFHRLLTTGNYQVDREEDAVAPQHVGWIIMAEHLNFFRFFEQLRCIHRGKQIAEMRSSEVRKFPSEGYGFLCMVHSPDGTDCGILNHLSTATKWSGYSTRRELRRVKKEITRYVVPATEGMNKMDATCPVWLEGGIFGFCKIGDAPKIAQALQRLKQNLTPEDHVQYPNLGFLEVIAVAEKPNVLGVYIFTEGGRMMRPIVHMKSAKTMYVGAWEQVWLNIAAVPSDHKDALDIQRSYEYAEISAAGILSLTSQTIPYFEHNCSPRNLFQCGLSKQTCGTQMQGTRWRKEAKLFRLITPQRYLVRTLTMDDYQLDDFSLGVNAVVAVQSYTGYDMDDAVIINQSAVDRGMFHACITVSKIVEPQSTAPAPTPGGAKGTTTTTDDGVTVFYNIKDGQRVSNEVDDNGLPLKRRMWGNCSYKRDHSEPTLTDNTPVYATAKRFARTDPATGAKRYEYTGHQVHQWSHFDKGEDAWIHSVIPLTFSGPDVLSALFVFRIRRNPQVGDKFASRHGQKGTLPLCFKSHDLPFSARGIVPDVIINPNAFPSRMTVGMVLELLGAKLGAVEGRFVDHSAWSVVDQNPVSAEEMGEQLTKHGYHRHGREFMYCGQTGEAMEMQVFFGICGYQRLRHMVSDKWQARARTDHTHRAVGKTGQPVKGRKRHGGVRVGEMERDALLSHGIAEVVLDRLLHVSDKTKAFICSNCGGLLSVYEKHTSTFATWKVCKFCHAGMDNDVDAIRLIDIPQVLRLWAAELAGIGVRVTIKI